MSEEQFWNSNPRVWKIWEEAHKQKVNEVNMLNHVNGLYTLRALQVALEHGFSKGAKSEYFDKPIQLFELTEKEVEMEKEKALDNLVNFFNGVKIQE